MALADAASRTQSHTSEQAVLTENVIHVVAFEDKLTSAFSVVAREKLGDGGSLVSNLVVNKTGVHFLIQQHCA